MPTPKVVIHIHGSLPSACRPTVGNGLRALALGQALVARGATVSYLTHRRFYSVDAPPSEVSLFDTDLEFRKAVEDARPDLLICIQGEGLEYLPEDGFATPVLADWIAPRMLEFAFQGLPLEKWLSWWISAVRKADYHSCCTERQRAYLTFLLQLAGIPLEPDRTLVVPLSASYDVPPRPQRGTETVFVSGGVSWPWIRSERFLRLLLEEMDTAGHGQIHVFGGSYPFQSDADAYRNPTESLAAHPRLKVHGMLPYPRLLESYSAADVALDLFEDNAERRLALSFREMDYLSCGLPIICPAFSEISGEVSNARAGWVLSDLSDQTVRTVFREILSLRPLPESFSQAARGLAASLHSPRHTSESIWTILQQGPAKADYGPALFQSALLWSERARQELERVEIRLRSAQAEIVDLRTKLDASIKLVEDKEADLLHTSGMADELRKHAASLQKELRNTVGLLSEKDQALGWQRAEIHHSEEALARLNHRVVEATALCRRKEEECSAKHADLVRTAAVADELRKHATSLESELSRAVKVLSEKDQALGWQRAEILHFEQAMNRVDRRIAEASEICRRKDEECSKRYAEWEAEENRRKAWWEGEVRRVAAVLEAENSRLKAAGEEEIRRVHAGWEAENNRLKIVLEDEVRRVTAMGEAEVNQVRIAIEQERGQWEQEREALQMETTRAAEARRLADERAAGLDYALTNIRNKLPYRIYRRLFRKD